MNAPFFEKYDILETDEKLSFKKGNLYKIVKEIYAIPLKNIETRKNGESIWLGQFNADRVLLKEGKIILYLGEYKLNNVVNSIKILANNELYITYNEHKLKKYVVPLTE